MLIRNIQSQSLNFCCVCCGKLKIKTVICRNPIKYSATFRSLSDCASVLEEYSYDSVMFCSQLQFPIFLQLCSLLLWNWLLLKQWLRLMGIVVFRAIRHTKQTEKKGLQVETIRADGHKIYNYPEDPMLKKTKEIVQRKLLN